MSIGGKPAADYSFQAPPVSVAVSQAFEEAEARNFAGLSPYEYETLPGTRAWLTEETPLSKCDVLVLYRLHNRVVNAPQDAANRDMQRKMKRNQHGR